MHLCRITCDAQTPILSACQVQLCHVQTTSAAPAAQPKKAGERSGARASLPLSYEERLWACGHQHVAGVDEAGRGPLAGPVCSFTYANEKTSVQQHVVRLMSPACVSNSCCYQGTFGAFVPLAGICQTNPGHTYRRARRAALRILQHSVHSVCCVTASAPHAAGHTASMQACVERKVTPRVAGSGSSLRAARSLNCSA